MAERDEETFKCSKSFEIVLEFPVKVISPLYNFLTLTCLAPDEISKELSILSRIKS